ncbi:MAG: hypothetical protein ACRDY3_01775 [Acidimicrobiales bacterium]
MDRAVDQVRTVVRTVTAGAEHLRTRAPRAVAALRLVLYLCAVAVVAVMAYLASRDVHPSSLRPWPLLGAFALALVWWSCLALGWGFLVGDTRRHGAVASWCRTQVARYLPGGIWAVAARATTVRGRLRDKFTAVTVENVIVLLTALAVGGAWSAAHDVRWLPLVALAAVPLVGSRWLERRTRVTGRAVRRTEATYAVGYVAYGVLAVLVQAAVSGWPEPSQLLSVAGAACVAWAVGLVVVFAPGGLGVRELVYVGMLAGVYPRGELLAAAVASRLVMILAELVVLAVTARPGSPRPGQPADALSSPTSRTRTEGSR